jgi:hypothetical protein
LVGLLHFVTTLTLYQDHGSAYLLARDLVFSLTDDDD